LLTIKENKCIQCRLCEEVCPNPSMQFIQDAQGHLVRQFRQDLCWECGLCVAACPRDVLAIADQPLTVVQPEIHTTPYAHTVQLPPVFDGNVIVEHVQQVAKSTYYLRLYRPPFSFFPGQYANIYLDTITPRAYSIASSPHQRDCLEFFINTRTGGFGGDAITRIQQGQSLRILAPFGNFIPTLTDLDRPKVFISYGTGVAPLRSMVHWFLAQGKQTPLLIFHGSRKKEEIFLSDEFHGFTQQYQQVGYYISVRDQDKQGSSLMTEQLLSQISVLQQAEIYLCGGSRFIQTICQPLLQNGVQQHQIFYEKYD